MALPIWQRTITTASGDLVPNAEITVVNELTGLGADIFSNREGTAPLGSGGVFFTGSDGFARFYAAPGEYRVTASGVSGSQTWRWIALVSDTAFMANQTGDATLRTAASYDATDDATPNTVVLRDANGTTEFADATEDQHPVTLAQFIEAAQWLGTAVSEPKVLMTNDANLYPPKDSALFSYILLSAGEDGVGDYNEGLLINETITGSGDLIEATAEINMPASPLHGTVVHLMNTEETVIVAGETAGVFALDQMQRLTGAITSSGVHAQTRSDNLSPSGAFGFEVNPSGTTARPVNETLPDRANMTFNSANSPNARTSATTEGSTKPKRVSAQIFLRIA